MMKLYKVGRDGTLYPKSVYPSDWKSEFGYEPVVASSSEQEANDVKTVQKFQAVTAQSPNNIVLRKISLKRQLGLLDLTPEELKEVEDAEDKMEKQAEAAAMATSTITPPPMAPNAPVANAPVTPNNSSPVTPPEDISQEMAKLSSLIGA
jgi:hypothetical protein